MKIIITESQYNLLVESKIENFKKFLKDNFDFELSVKIIDQYEDLPIDARSVAKWFFRSQRNAFGPLYLVKFKNRTFLFVDNKTSGGYSIEFRYDGDNEPSIPPFNYNGDELSDIFNIDDVGLDITDIIKLYV
jgi:hypothetical protein